MKRSQQGSEKYTHTQAHTPTLVNKETISCYNESYDTNQCSRNS